MRIHGALGALDVHALVAQLQLLHDEGLEQLQRHFLGQTALMQLHFRADDDNGTAGIVNALAQQVLSIRQVFFSHPHSYLPFLHY